MTALRLAATGRKSDIAKPLIRFRFWDSGSRVTYRGDAYRTVYAVQLGDDLWVIHAFKKKSTQGIKTAKKDLDVIAEQIKQLKKELPS